MRTVDGRFQLTRRRLLQASAAGGVGLLVGGCGDDGGGGGGDLPTVSIQALDGGMSALSLRVVEEEGFDEANGFKGDFQYVSADASSQNFRGHESQVSFDIGPPDVGVMKSKGDDVVIFSGNTKNHLRVICRADAPFTKIEDLAGRKFGHYGDDSTGTLSLALLLDQYHNGMNLHEDFKLVLAAPPALIPLLASDQVDAVLSFEPHISRATEVVKGGVKEIYDLGTDWQEHSGGTLWTTTLGAFRSWVTDNPKLAKGVHAAWQDAAKFMNANPDKLVAGRTYQDLLGLKTDASKKKFVDYLRTRKLFAAGLSADDADNIEEFLALMAKQGTLFKKAPKNVAVPLETLLK